MADQTSDAPEARKVKGPSMRTLVLAEVALFVLAGASLALHFAHTGAFSYLIGYGIALVMGTLVATAFMEVGEEQIPVRLAFGAALALFALLLALTAADLLTRTVPPLDPPPGNAPRVWG